jgi:DNA primase
LVEGYTDVISLHQAGIENVVASGGTSLTVEQLRLIKKYTNNLTIIYDGDAAGVKAALRGLDMALEEGLNVKLVLIPDKEDPDSYVLKLGTTAFQQFIADNKKDFILFQLEVMLKEAGNDVTKKSEIVNQIAATLSRIDRTEDFTKLQDYIKHCATLLKIDEAGLTTLVNKFKRDKISKEEKKLSVKEADYLQQQVNEKIVDDNFSLLQQDDLYERNVLRVLLEYGLKKFDEQHTVANYILTELEQFVFDNKQLESLYNEYKTQYLQGLQPNTKKFLYHPNEMLRNLVISLTVTQYELSAKWDERIEGLNIANKDNSLQDVMMSINYFKLRKIKRMFEQNQHDMENASEEELKQLIYVHQHLKLIEQTITKQLGTVIY